MAISRADSRVKMWRFTDFRGLTLFPSSGCVGGLVQSEPTLLRVYLRPAGAGSNETL
jgi:hypothetical protein